MRRTVAVFGSMSLLGIACVGTQHHESAAAPEAQRVQLVSGLAPHHHPIATDSAEAQAFFDQGFA